MQFCLSSNTRWKLSTHCEATMPNTIKEDQSPTASSDSLHILTVGPCNNKYGITSWMKNIFSSISQVMRRVNSSGFGLYRSGTICLVLACGWRRQRSHRLSPNNKPHCSLRSVLPPPLPFVVLDPPPLPHLSPPVLSCIPKRRPHAAPLILVQFTWGYSLTWRSMETLPVWSCQISGSFSFDSLSPIRLSVSLCLIPSVCFVKKQSTARERRNQEDKGRRESAHCEGLTWRPLSSHDGQL